MENNKCSFEISEFIRKGKFDKVKKIIGTVGFSYSKSWQGGYSLLYWALEYNYINIAKWLLLKNCQANPENPKFSQKSALHLAIHIGKVDLVKMLLKKGASVTATNEYLETPLHVSCKRRRIDIVKCDTISIIKLLLKYGAPVNEKGGLCKETPLIYALKNKHQGIKIIKLLLDNGADINEFDMYRKTPLHIAIEYKDKKTIKFLLEHGANVNFKNSNGRSPLHVATKVRSIEIVKILLSNNADVNEIIHDFEECRWTALHIAVKNKDDKMIKLLLENNANVNAKEDHHRTPLHIAAVSHNLDTVKMLVAAGAGVNNVDKQGQIPLHLAIKIEDERMVELLIENNSDIHAKRKDGKTSLHFAAENHSSKIAKLLIKKGANINDATLDGRTVLHFAAKKGSKELVELFLKLGIDIDIKTHLDKFTPLYYAVKKRHCDVAEYLLYTGAYVNVKVKVYQTLLRLAVYDMNKDMVKLLLNWDADINAEDNDDETPLLIATDSPRYEDIPGSEMMHEITSSLVMYIAKLVAQNKYVSEQNLNLISINNRLSQFYKSCQKELDYMKSRKIFDNVTYFDILSKSTNSMVSYSRNKHIVKALEADYTKIFPIYCSMMIKNFMRGKLKENLLELGAVVLKLLFNNTEQNISFELPYFVIRQILDYLNIKDLKVLTSLFQKV